MALGAALAQSAASPRGSNEDDVQLPSRGLAFVAVVLCGTLNNLPYCIISGASQDLARQFGQESQVTLITTAMNFSALMATLISTRLLLRFPFRARVRLVLAMNAVAYSGVAASSSLHSVGGLFPTVFFAAVAGMAGIFGETTLLAFLKVFPSELMGGWGAGTGIAGILGGALYILLRSAIGLGNTIVFLLVLPTVLLYWAAFGYLHARAKHGQSGGGHQAASLGAGTRSPLAAQHDGERRTRPAPATIANMHAAVRYSGGIMFNMVAVYCLEYIIYPGLDDRETMCASKSWYTAMWVFYNVGVTVSRFSVALFRIRRIWLLTALQLLNVLGWTAEVYTGVVRNVLPNMQGLCFMAVWMTVVGLCGGATYANCMYMFNRQPDIPDDLRELGINLGFVMSNIGITTATLSFSLLDRTLMAKSVIYPHGCPGAGP